jgi:hypothetical protein
MQRSHLQNGKWVGARGTARLGILALGVLLAVAGGALSSCDGLFSNECTLRGCDSHLVLGMAGELDPEFTLSLTLPDGTTETVHCSASQPCRVFYFPYPGVTSRGIAVEYRAANFEQRRTLHPEYKLFQPNGPRCEPTCRTATIVFQVERPE